MAISTYVKNLLNIRFKQAQLGTLIENSAPDKVIVASGTFTTAGGDTSESITVASCVATDLVFVQVVSGTGYVVSANSGSGSIAVEMSADPGAATVLQYVVIR